MEFRPQIQLSDYQMFMLVHGVHAKNVNMNIKYFFSPCPITLPPLDIGL
jgi:hypothetical protein